MHTCPICDHGVLQTRTYGRDMQHKGVDISVEGLQYDYCPDCEAEMTSPAQLDQNAKIIREAFIAERVRVKHEQNLLTGAEIRLIREHLGITQKQASKIFGGGPPPFQSMRQKMSFKASEWISCCAWPQRFLLLQIGCLSVQEKG